MNSIQIHFPCTQFVTNTAALELLTAIKTDAILYALEETRSAPKNATPKAVRQDATPALRNANKMVVMGKCLAKRERSVNKNAALERVRYLATILKSVIKNVPMKSVTQHVARESRIARRSVGTEIIAILDAIVESKFAHKIAHFQITAFRHAILKNVTRCAPSQVVKQLVALMSTNAHRGVPLVKIAR